MIVIETAAPVAVAAVAAIRTGDLPALRQLLAEHPELATARLGTRGCSRTLLHVATDWPGHFPGGAGTVRLLVAAGADEAEGAVIAGGSPLRDATAFAQWRAARRLVERGARTTSFDAAALGLLDRLATVTGPELDNAFWAACHGGQRPAAEFLLERGADLDRLPGWEALTPLDAAARSGAHEVVRWLHARGARLACQAQPSM